MTGKASRKQLKRQRRLGRRHRTITRPAAPMIVAGAFFASAALGGASLRAQALQSATAIDRPVAADAGGQPTHRFEIKGGPLGEVLAEYERVTGVRAEITLEDMKVVYSPGASGTLTDAAALQQILTGTSISFRFTSPRVVTFEFRGATESVEVRGAAPAVSSPKYIAPLREVPQTIEVIPRAAIEEQGVTTLTEALRFVPGITLQAGEGGGASNTAGDMFNMRGFNAANSLFVDGVRDDGLISRDIFNVEQIEVFMGPTGTDVGRGTAAGYINMQTKSPTLAGNSSALLSYGSAGQKRATVDVGRAVPLAAAGSWLHNTAARLNVLWQDSGVPGRDVVEQERRAIAPSLAFGLETPTRLTLGAQIMRQDNVPDYGLPGAAWHEPLTPTSALAPAAVDQRNFYGSVNYDQDKSSQNSYTVRFEHDVNQRLSLRNQTRYNQAHREALITAIQNVAAYNPETNLVTLARQGSDRENEIFSNQTSLTDRFTTGRLNHATHVGVEYTFEKQFAPTLTGLGTRAPANIFNPDPLAVVTGFAPARSAVYTKGWTDTIALYGFDTVDLGKWQLSGGVRWEHYKTNYDAADAAGLLITDLEASDFVVSGKAGILYRVAPAGNFYLSYGTTTTPPGTANFTLSAQANNANNPSVEPQKSTNYEAGSKWDFANGRVSLNASVFHTENENVIFTVDPTAVPPIYNQDDEQRVNGATIGLGGRITPAWEVLADFTYLDSALVTQNISNGNRLQLTPEFSGSLWTTYRLPMGLTFGGGIRHLGSVFVNAANTIQSPGYQLIDALVEYEVNSHLSLRLNLYNLADEVYVQNVNNNGGRYNPGIPRSAMVTSAFRF